MQSRIPVLHTSPPSPTPSTQYQLHHLAAGSPGQLRSSTSSAGSETMSTLSETRARQKKRDEALRNKIQTDLAKKRGTPKRAPGSGDGSTPSRAPGGGGANGSTRRGGAGASAHKAGTVSALRPTPALTVPSTLSVSDAAQLCAAKRTDCVLVVNEQEHLCGIFTAKDLAFRVIGEGLDPRATHVSQIMTPDPMVTKDTTSATEALQTMVQRHFRHLPVCNEEGDVVGLLDITKVFHESLEKLERAYGSSQKLYSALEGVHSEWGPGASNGFSGANNLMNYVEALREKMSFPDLGSILDDRTRAVTVSVKTSVKEAARLMREHRTTAVCVLEDSGKLAGIFTSKDVVLRVIAAGLDSRTCSVVRVMTPHPDTGLPTLTIQQALRKMNDGRFLNLPVVEEDGSLVGCVDVLKLTYATLEQVSSIGAENGGDQAGGPLWSRFFSSFASMGDGDTESAVSDSHAPSSSVAPQTPNAMPKHLRNDSNFGSISPSEIHPNDSASVVNDDDETSELGIRNRKAGAASAVTSAAAASTLPQDDGTYLFKFMSPSGTTHRFVARYDNYASVRDIIGGKLASDPFFVQHNATKAVETGIVVDPLDFMVSYTDDEGDLVLMSADGDLEDSVKTARKATKDRVVLVIKGGKGWEDAIASTSEQQTERKKNLKVVEEEKEEDNEVLDDLKASVSSDGRMPKKLKRPAHHDDELVFGFLQKDMVLPAAIALLSVTIVGVFLVSRTSKK